MSVSPIRLESADGPGPVMNLNARLDMNNRHPISTGDLNSDCLQRLITVHTIVSLQLFSVLVTGLCGLPYALTLSTFSLRSISLCSFCVAVVEIQTQ